ncbi:MAG: phosphotransferase [Candidatus Poribacteria bacterium]|nr:phosphotransferase [Candidatus Poribacteria bacterium]
MDIPLSLIEKSLSRALKYEIRLAKCAKFKKKRIFRCWVADGPSSLPEVFLVKMARHTKREPYNRESDCVGSPTWKLFNEWAALQFLSQIDSTRTLAPEFIAGDAIQGLIAFKYVSKARSFRDILRNSNEDERRHALLTYAQAIGRMHGATYGRRNQWLRLRTGLGTFPQADPSAFDGILQTCRRLATFVEQPVSFAVKTELSELKETLSDAEPFSALRHVDIAPQNYLLLNDGVKIVDFEYSDYGHFLLDAPLGPYPFPVRWECDDVLAREIENVYRSELSSGFPGALDDSIYYKGILAAWIYWLLRLGPIPRTGGNTMKGIDSLAGRCKAVARLSHEIEYLPQIGRIFAQVAAVHESH